MYAPVGTMNTDGLEIRLVAGESKRNLAKHKVSFETASQVFSDPYLIVVEDREDEGGELRYHAIGRVASQVLLVVHFISARKAEDYEQRTYARQFQEGH
jgi:uncharacterized DUF497 family protein